MEPAPRRYPGQVLRVASDYGWRLLLLGTVVYFGVQLLSHLATAVIPFIVALMGTAMLRPIFNWLRRRGVPRSLATLLTFLLAVVVIGGILTLVVIRAVDQAPQLGAQINRIIPDVKRWLENGPLHVNHSSVDNFSKSLTTEISRNTSTVANTALSTGKTVLDVVTGLVLAIFVTIVLLYDGEGVWSFLVKAVPVAGRDRADRAGRAAWQTLGYYMRGTLVVAAFHGIVIAITLTLLGVPLVAPLALLIAIGSFVPLVGAVVTGVVAAGVATIEQGLGAGVVVVAVLVIDNQIEAHGLQPFVVGRYVHIHPLATVMALTAGALLFGIFGAIIAVPVVACVNAAVRAAMG
ncbi:MAG: AI-2E family transporter, partial [Acidimicrobiales bacterium]